jgi:O-antigen/teichoic acid export membrane protein
VTPEDATVPELPAELDEPLDGPPHLSMADAGGSELDGPPGDLKRKTALSILWTIVRTGSDYFLSFVIFALLARKLGPAAFGVFTLAVAFAEFGKILPSTGLVSALTRAKHVSPAMADTVFWSTLAIACLIAGVMALIARPLAAGFGAPAVAPLLTALGLILPVSAAGATHIALTLRSFGHKAMASRSVVSGAVGGTAALAAAWAGWGPWSLVVQRAVTEIAGTAMAWHAYRWLPGRRFSSGALRDMAGFSASMTLTQVLYVGLVRVQDLIVGRTIGVPAVGAYRTAWRTVELIAQGAIMPFAQVSLPALARLQDDLPAFRKAYLRILGVSAALAFPAIIGFAVLAPDAVRLLYGDRWAASARIAQVLGLMAVPFTINYFAGPALAALGRSGTLAKIAALQLTLTVVLSLLAAPYGLSAIAGAYVLRAYLTLPVQMGAFKRYSGVGYGELLGAIAPPLFMALVMAGCLLGLDHLVGARIHNRGIFLLLMGCTGTAVYAASLLLFARSFVSQQINDIRRLLPSLSAKLSGAGA